MVDLKIQVEQGGTNPSAVHALPALGSDSLGFILPPSIQYFSCFGLNVTGPGIVPNAGDSACPSTSSGFPGPGIVTGLVPATDVTTISAKIPSGPSRRIQVFGIRTQDLACPAIFSAKSDIVDVSTFSTAFEIGSVTTDISATSEIAIVNNFQASNPKPVFCAKGSPEISGMNLAVPIDFLDRAVESDTATKTFSRSDITIDPSRFDGTVTYTFEIVGLNASGSSKRVWLVDSTSQEIATITLGASDNASTYFSTNFQSFPTASTTYKLKLEGTSPAGLLDVTVARIIVKQTDATKTSVYIPLINALSSQISNSDVSTGYVSSSGTSFSLNGYNSRFWTYRDSDFGTLDSSNSFTLDVTMTRTGSAGFVEGALYNSGGTAVASSVVSINVTTVDQAFSGTSTFPVSALSDGDVFNFRQRSVSAGNSYVARAGLWAHIKDLTKAPVHYRVASHLQAATTSAGTRAMINPANYPANSLYRFESTGSCTTASNPYSARLFSSSAATGATGTTETTQLINSTWTNHYNAETYFTAPTSARYYFGGLVSDACTASGSARNVGSYIVIRAAH